MKRLLGNKKLFVKLLEQFYDHYCGASEEIWDSVGWGAWNHAVALIHAMKGAASNFP